MPGESCPVASRELFLVSVPGLLKVANSNPENIIKGKMIKMRLWKRTLMGY
jgi:hypothetical protein